jgi:DNA-binding FadR family transcriptional regulator
MNGDPMRGDAAATVSGAQAAVPPELAEILAEIRRIHAETGSLPAERLLAERLGIKRHSLRRALQALRDEGAIGQPRPRSPGRSPRARQEDLVNMTNPVEVAELRRMIEPVLAKLAAMRATPSDIAAMQKEIDSGGRPGQDLHRMIAQATGNALAAEIYGLLRRIESDARLGAAQASGAGAVEKQRAVVEAIAARAPDKASEAMAETLAALYRQTLYDLD